MLRQQMNPTELVKKIKAAPGVALSRGTSLLDHVVAKMHEQELKKYPSSLYSYARGTVNHDGENLNYIHTSYNGKPLDQEQALRIKVAAIKLRKLSLLAGIIYTIDTPSFLTNDAVERKLLLDSFSNWLPRIVDAPLDSNPNSVNQFVNELVTNISSITKRSATEVIRQVRLAERYFVAEYQADLFLNETSAHEKLHTQLSVSFKNNLQQSQMQEWIRIHSDKKPDWFLRLSDWERNWFYQRVPTLFADKERWARFQRYFKSSAMSHIPGLSNLRRTYILEDQKVVSENIQLGTLMAYEMPKHQQDEDAKRNVHQLMKLLTARAREKMDAMWPNIKIKPIILIQSILSDTIGGDGELVKGQRKAIEAGKAAYSDDFELFHGNDPVNFLRLFSAESGMFSRNYTNRWDHTLNVLAYTERFIKLANQATISPEQLEKLTLIKFLKNELEWMHNSNHLTGLSRNFNAFKVAMTELLVEALGGQVSINCKSGKDRTGFASLYKQAIYYYYQEFHQLPHYNENGSNRENFINIFKDLFNSQRAQELAAWNTPGSFGLKDSAKMLCSDIAYALKHSYQRSNHLADMNKPSTIKKDEMLEVKEINRVKPLFVVREDYIDKKTNKLLEHIHTLKKSCPTWEPVEHYQIDKNELTRVEFSKWMPTGVKASFTATNTQIVTFDNETLVFEQMLKSFYAVNPTDKLAILTVLNEDVAQVAKSICEKMGVKHKLIIGQSALPKTPLPPEEQQGISLKR